MSHGRNRAHSPHRRLALVEPTREFGPFVKAGVRAGGSEQRMAAPRARRLATGEDVAGSQSPRCGAQFHSDAATHSRTWPDRSK